MPVHLLQRDRGRSLVVVVEHRQEPREEDRGVVDIDEHLPVAARGEMA